MVDYVDRVPTYPGRVRLTPVAGQTNVYDLTREDDPMVVGTPVNAALFAALQADQTEIGSYTGDGTAPTITFSFDPKAVLITSDTTPYYTGIWVKGSTKISEFASNATSPYGDSVTVGTKSLTLSSSNFGVSGKDYFWIAIR